MIGSFKFDLSKDFDGIYKKYLKYVTKYGIKGHLKYWKFNDFDDIIEIEYNGTYLPELPFIKKEALIEIYEFFNYLHIFCKSKQLEELWSKNTTIQVDLAGVIHQITLRLVFDHEYENRNI